MKKLKLDITHITQPEIERLVGELAETKLQIDQKTHALQADMLALEDKLKPIRSEHAATQACLTLERNALQQTYNEKHALVEAWASAQKPLLFQAKRSIEFLRGVIGFRLDTPSIDSLPKWTFTKAVQALKGTRWGKQYLTYREPVLNKEALLADRAKLLKNGRLAEVGLTIAQEDRFYFEPKREGSDAVGQLEAAA